MVLVLASAACLAMLRLSFVMHSGNMRHIALCGLGACAGWLVGHFLAGRDGAVVGTASGAWLLFVLTMVWVAYFPW